MSDRFHDRYKSRQRETEPVDRPGSIFGIWDEQRRMQAEEEKMALELAETKRKAKELQRTLRKHRYGEASSAITLSSKKYLNKLLTYSKKVYIKTKSLIRHNKKPAFGLLSLLIIITVGFVGYSNIKSDDSTSTLGESTARNPIAEDLPREKPGFSLLLPSGSKTEDYDIVRISPDEADASFTYLDRFTDDGQIFRVTQQEIPDNFDLSKTATDFQATSVIQIDDNVIYHGYSEQGGVQSLIFIKDNKLISIRSPQKFADDLWASYVISLQ
jgi:hypothetical protein